MAVSPRLRELLSLARQTRTYLTYLEGLGVTRLPTVEGVSLPDDALDHVLESLEEIREDLGKCTRCGLAADRQSVVFGQGAARAPLMLIGEAPREPDDAAGEPFLGEPGRLLTDIIVKGLSLNREACYLTTLVKCRPAGDRPPLPLEIRTCRPFLMRQIASIRPRVILTLGETAGQALLETDQPLTRLRGRFHDFRGFSLLPTYHPEDILKDTNLRRPVWEDVKRVIARLQGS